MRSRAQELGREFSLDGKQLAGIAGKFRKALEDGLAGRPSSLKMLPSFISEPGGSERGRMLAVDFGGTNVRVLLAELDGRGGARIERISKFPLRASDGSYDYVSASAKGEELFDYIAEKIAEIAPREARIPLGLTFSFPCEQRSINSAFLIHWTKEILTGGVEGVDVAGLLSRSLARKGLPGVAPAAVINDTVGTLLAAGYANRDVDIASICGTGHNSCYLERRHPLTGAPMVVNMESGNFDGAPQTEIDAELDAMSEMPGSQRFEKMISGHYLGEIVRLALRRMVREGGLPECGALDDRSAVRGQDIDAILADDGSLRATASFAEGRLGLGALGRESLEAIKTANDGIARRSARLVAAAFAGTLDFVDPGLERDHCIAVDGSLYEKMPGYGNGIATALSEIYGERASRVRTVLAKDGSGIGAVVAAAVASRA